MKTLNSGILKYFSCLLLFLASHSYGQVNEVRVSGTVTTDGKPVPFASVFLKNGKAGTNTDIDGNYELDVPVGEWIIVAQSQGYRSQSRTITLMKGKNAEVDFKLTEDALGLEGVVVSATRNRISRKEAPVIVNVLNPKLFRATQSISLADGLNFQPGVRIETNCQNCGFTQVRLNGLEGQYTQILVNSRPVFSALNGVYGLEQIPVSIIERLEVVRSGGSALFGSNAIAGTINVITREPVINSWEISSNLGIIGGTTADRNVNLNASIVSEDLSSGVTVYGIFRDRDAYDANGDGFSEITKLSNNSLGAKAFLRPNDNSRLGIDFTGIREYRRGGDRINLAPQFTDITEELDHKTIFTGVDYQLFDETRENEFTAYLSVQHTDRDSYYGGLGGGRTAADSVAANNAFGLTKDLAIVAGSKYTHTFKNRDIITTGLEYQLNDTEDAIPGYNRLVDQQVNSYGLYAQYEWKPVEKFTALLGARLDHVDVDGFYTIQDVDRSSQVNETVLSPRLTVLYNISESLQFRGGYARGFRAPQAFNEDLHISSVGGEQRFVILSDDLENEYSNAYTASLNFTKDFRKTQTNFLLEGFYTTLQNPFTIVSTGTSLPNGSILEESRNGSGAYVAGTNMELSVSPSPAFLFKAGATIQRSVYKEEQLLYEATGDVPGEQDVTLKDFARSPNVYGFINANWTMSEAFQLDLTGSYTGTMIVPHVISDSGFIRLEDSEDFLDLTTKLTYHFDLAENFHVELSGGVQNLFNSYQDNFDSGPLRDSDFIYGPNRPRTVFVGLKFGDF
ncbi:TonB-dependent receptor [Zeaxanthinibacter enoshimensis]|uniref:Outer membrane receptor for ferrienterochelin and colicins n=1 Tax=Zeaxanthinibacter enoshimensis TaxID=392009 RepID=A0A4R6TNA7_9FLAO|nr:TonB-dependent receptor [Zeaxanthinibacter enoshimensis]TDQ31095.1 outer membrane receptor for ferrienterochelin and colicins [Zeaxanthinibacter enoshimensis]